MKNKVDFFLKRDIRLRSGVLVYVVGMVLVISVLLMSFLTVRYFSVLTYQVSWDSIRDESLLREGTKLLTLNSGLTNATHVQRVSLFGEGKDSLAIEVAPWGMFKVVDMSTLKGKRRTFFLGDDFSDGYAVFLEDSPIHFKLNVGSSLEGDVMVPNGDVKLGEGNSNHVTGNIEKSNDKLPDLNNHVFNVFSWGDSLDYELFESIDVENNFSQSNVLCLFSEDEIVVSGQVKGKVVLKSNTKIEVLLSADIQDAILMAPNVEINDFVQGSFQAIASDTIVVGSGVRLDYPSVLAVVGDSSGLVRVGSGYIEGCIVQTAEDGLIQIKDDIKVDGVIYSKGYADVKGVVRGSIYAKKFRADLGGVIEENVLQDTEVLKPEFNGGVFGIPLMFEDMSNSVILKWLD